MILNEQSVDGWMNPPETMLRFPVELRENAKLSFIMGANPQIAIRIHDLVMRVEYVPDLPQIPPVLSEDDSTQVLDSEPAANPEPVTVYETTPEYTPQCFGSWYHVDISLASWAPGSGELRFSTEGNVAADPGLNFMWGRPVIYYPPEQRHKNILLIGVDTLRRDVLTPFGAAPDVTPNLQELSESSTIFTQARSQSSWTLPSFASMLTGNLPSTIGSTVYSGHLPPHNDTIGEILLANGYATATICSNSWLGNENSGFHQGIEQFWYRYNASAYESVEWAEDFITSSRSRDWFCFLHFLDPHTPYAPANEFIEQFTDPDYDGPYQQGVGSMERWKSGEEIPADDDRNQAWNLYRGEVALLDDALADLFSFLEENGLMDETLIIFTSDHGEEFFEHGGFEHGHTQFDELVWIPLIIRGDGFPPGGSIDTNVGNTDIVPTILEYTGIPLMDDLAGRPLQNAVSGLMEDDRLIFGEDNTRGTLRKFAVEWPYKCILDFVTGDSRLYNLEADPGELVDISGSNIDLTTRLSAEIVSAMLPRQTAFHCWITRSYREPAQTFTGTLRIPDGIEEVVAFMLAEGDSYELDGDTVTFTITSTQEVLGPNKHLLIFPSPGADTIEVTVQVNGQTDPSRFFPYGSSLLPEVTGSATVSLDQFPLGHDLPWAIEQFPARCYIWGVRGYQVDENRQELDEQALEQLRALGYI